MKPSAKPCGSSCRRHGAFPGCLFPVRPYAQAIAARAPGLNLQKAVRDPPADSSRREQIPRQEQAVPAQTYLPRHTRSPGRSRRRVYIPTPSGTRARREAWRARHRIPCRNTVPEARAPNESSPEKGPARRPARTQCFSAVCRAVPCRETGQSPPYAGCRCRTVQRHALPEQPFP